MEEGRYGLYKQGSGLWRSLRNGEFQEGDVWDVLEERKDFVVNNNHPRSVGNSREGKSGERESSTSTTTTPRHIPNAARMIPRTSTTKNPTHETKVVQQSSAPVNIPDWSRFYGKKISSSKKGSKNTNSWLDDDDDDDDDNDVDDGNDGFVNDGDDSEDDDDGHDFRKLPPHEWIAKRLAMSHISSFSVFEGAGRTLKGRDLSKVRNAVLTKTGFLE